MGALAGVIAHGGTTGLLVELSIAVVAAAGLGWIWWYERRRRSAKAQRSTTKPP